MIVDKTEEKSVDRIEEKMMDPAVHSSSHLHHCRTAEPDWTENKAARPGWIGPSAAIELPPGLVSYEFYADILNPVQTFLL